MFPAYFTGVLDVDDILKEMRHSVLVKGCLLIQKFPLANREPAPLGHTHKRARSLQILECPLRSKR